MVTAYDIERRETVFFNSWRDRFDQIRALEACRATSAAPTYFEPAHVDLDGGIRTLVDGGVFINSPSVSAYAEALKLFPGEEFQMLSLGTGEPTRTIHKEDADGWGKAGWLLPLLSCMFDGMADAADHQMRLFLGERYQRLQLTLMGANDDMDDATPENLALLEGLAHEMMDTKAAVLDEVLGWF
jgi:patatin-like phospholipase/acyl hydrolase